MGRKERERRLKNLGKGFHQILTIFQGLDPPSSISQIRFFFLGALRRPESVKQVEIMGMLGTRPEPLTLKGERLSQYLFWDCKSPIKHHITKIMSSEDLLS